MIFDCTGSESRTFQATVSGNRRPRSNTECPRKPTVTTTVNGEAGVRRRRAEIEHAALPDAGQPAADHLVRKFL